MKLSIQRIIAEAHNSMSTNNAYFKFKLANISINAEAEALLTVSVSTDDGDVGIEEVADVAIPREDVFVIVPKRPIYLFEICKAIAVEHPEYKIEKKVYIDDGDENDTSLESFLVDESDDVDEEDLVICCTMPEMNEDRHDAAIDMVNIFYDQATVMLDELKVDTQTELAEKLSKSNPQELEDAQNSLKEIYDQCKKECDNYKQEKEEQIDKAFQKYLKKKNQQKKKVQELEAAQGKEAAKSMSLDSLLNPEE